MHVNCLSLWLELLLSKLRPRDLSMVVTVRNSGVFWVFTRGVLVLFWGPVVVPPYPQGMCGLQIADTTPCIHCVFSCTDTSFHLEEVLPASLWHVNCQHRHSCTLGPLLSEIMVTRTQALWYWDCWSDTWLLSDSWVGSICSVETLGQGTFHFRVGQSVRFRHTAWSDTV